VTVEIRPAPSTTGSRNGMPESGGYVYRGCGVDIMPWAITDDDGTDYDSGVKPWVQNDVQPRPRKPRTVRKPPKPRSRQSRAKCPVCGYGDRSPNHRVLCG